MKKVRIKVRLVLDDWRDPRDIKRSIYHTPTGTELSLSAFHHGSTFDGEIEVDEKDAEFLRGAMKDNFCPTFVALDPKVQNWRWT